VRNQAALGLEPELREDEPPIRLNAWPALLFSHETPAILIWEANMSTNRSLRRTWNRLLGSLSGQRRESDLAEELDSHIQLMADEYVRQGSRPEWGRNSL
jgi:hypothetical protein